MRSGTAGRDGRLLQPRHAGHARKRPGCKRRMRGLYLTG
jgi:hypothetical protein